jgi:hypothetical protein
MSRTPLSATNCRYCTTQQHTLVGVQVADAASDVRGAAAASAEASNRVHKLLWYRQLHELIVSAARLREGYIHLTTLASGKCCLQCCCAQVAQEAICLVNCY